MPRRLRVPRYTSVLAPEEQFAFMRSLPVRRGARQRLAGVPEWDGTVRFPQTGDNEPWSDEELAAAAWQAMRDFGVFTGEQLEVKLANDPRAVVQDIRSHPEGPWGPAPGYRTWAAGELAYQRQPARLRRIA